MDLPNEIQSMILGFLSAEDLATAELVCWQWKTLAHALWKRLAIVELVESGLELEVAQKAVERARAGQGHEDARRLYRMVRSGLVEACAAVDLITKPNLKNFVNLAHGPVFSKDYWFQEHDESASHERALVLRQTLWFFTFEAHKAIYESGTYTCAWRMKLKQHARTSELVFSVTGMDKKLTFSKEIQDRLRGRGWFYVVIQNVRLEAGVQARFEGRETSDIHSGYCLDCAIILPAALLERAFPEGVTFYLN